MITTNFLCNSHSKTKKTQINMYMSYCSDQILSENFYIVCLHNIYRHT